MLQLTSPIKAVLPLPLSLVLRPLCFPASLSSLFFCVRVIPFVWSARPESILCVNIISRKDNGRKGDRALDLTYPAGYMAGYCHTTPPHTSRRPSECAKFYSNLKRKKEKLFHQFNQYYTTHSKGDRGRCTGEKRGLKSLLKWVPGKSTR